MPPKTASAGSKRKAQHPPNSLPPGARKRQKFQDARTVSTETADAALSKAGELNIASFIKTREFEIAALDKSMKKARQALSARAFQQVPRHLRRRTASHNAKKVPRRLRGRAAREMIEDNTPTVNSRTRKPTSRLRLRLETAKALKKLNRKRRTVRQKKREARTNATEPDPAKHVDVVRVPRIKKNTLAKPPLATSKFKRRQISKTWLPTHMWHTKRAHMTKPTEPLWRMAIPLRPTEKSYRATHRASQSRGCVVWDMSYISTVICRGTDTTLEKLLRVLAFDSNIWTGKRYIHWKSGSRFAEGWVQGIETRELIAPVTVIWCSRSTEEENVVTDTPSIKVDINAMSLDGSSGIKKTKRKLDRQLMIRVHPSAFYQFWTELLKAAKAQKPQVLVEDLRFEIGSIEMIGPASTEALFESLTPSNVDDDFQRLWSTILPISNPALLPSNPVLTLDVHDPRVSPNSRSTTRTQPEDLDALHEMAASWPFDKNPRTANLFSHKARFRVRALPSQWALNRRRQGILPGQAVQFCNEDPKIPVMLLAHRGGCSTTNRQGSWTLLAPWQCIDLIWRRLLCQNLSSGGKPRFGGLQQKQQTSFEQACPLFPADYPGTEAGKAWEKSQAEERFDEWVKHPPSRRIAWDNLDLGLGRRGELGRGWLCDWEYLLNDSCHVLVQPKIASPVEVKRSLRQCPKPQLLLTQRQRKAARVELEKQKESEESEALRRNTSSPEAEDASIANVIQEAQFAQCPNLLARELLRSIDSSALPSKAMLVNIRITLLTRGHPQNAARIYRLPHEQASSFDPKSLSETLPENTGRPATSKSANPVSDCLRNRWLQSVTTYPSHKAPRPVKKDKLNHHGHQKKARALPSESLRHINVLPKNASVEVREQYGPKPLSEEDKAIQLAREMAIRTEERKTWEIHIPCPDSKDLIGFVTSGGYNLAQGKGTAIGSIWLQKIVQGWAAEERVTASQHHFNVGLNGKEELKPHQHSDGRKHLERHLCIVRNAGESVGRLAEWELCE